ncbi:hypothetical protein D3C73_939880 [compost metagenome]
MTRSVVSARTVQRRSILRVPMMTPGPAIAAITAVVVIDWPATPVPTPRSAESGVNRLTGRNSAVTRPNTPKVNEATAPQRATSCSVRAASSDDKGVPCMRFS